MDFPAFFLLLSFVTLRKKHTHTHTHTYTHLQELPMIGPAYLFCPCPSIRNHVKTAILKSGLDDFIVVMGRSADYNGVICQTEPWQPGLPGR
jgi:hypothetical protein